MANELLITINANAKNVKKAYDDIRAQTEDLESTLKGVAKVSAVAFAAFTAEIALSVAAFEASEKSSRKLATALQNQGIYTKALVQDYKGYAAAVQAATGLDDDAVVSAQAVAQGYLGQTEITKELTFAIADLAESMGGDLNGAAEMIGRTIGTNTNAFRRQGLVISETATEAERMAKTLEFVNIRAGGMAAAANQGVGGLRGLVSAFGDFQESIGARFAPVVGAAIALGTRFFTALNQSPIIADLAVALLTAGAAVTGVVTAVAVGIPVFLALKAAIIAAGLSLSVAFVGIPLLVGAVIAAATLLALNWDKAMAAIRAAASATVTLISEMFSGVGKVLAGAFTLDKSKIQQGLNDIKNSFKSAKDTAISTYTEITATQQAEADKQDAAKKAAADRQAAIERQHQANLRAIRQAEIDLLKLQTENASATLIALKQKEIEVLKALDQEKSQQELAFLRQKHAQIVALQSEQFAEDQERATAFAALQAEMKAEMDAQGIAVDAQIREEKLAELRAQAQTEADIERQLQEQMLSQRTAARNQELLDRKKFGERYAVINKALQSDEVQGAKSAANELVALQQSKNATLKSIGKVAAVASITISTAESAMNIYRGFSTIPIIGPALGVAGAAAAVAFGAERIGAVTAAAKGGLIEGGIPGVDSVPALLQQGELVVPRKNFDDVVGAVKGESSGGRDEEILSALLSIDQKFSNPQTTIIQGDLMADDSFVDALIRRISDRIEFGNAQIYGVTS